MKISKLLCGAFITLAAASASAQAVAPNDSLLPEFAQQHAVMRSSRFFFDGDNRFSAPQRDSINNVINKFYLDQFRHSQDPKIPYFMFMSKDASLAMGIGGTIQIRGWFDWNGAIDDNDFEVYNISVPKDPARMKALGYTPSGTSIFYTILGRNKILGQYMGYVQGNFKGYKNINFKLKKAYLTFRDWTLGYASSTFSDPAAEPPVLDGAGSGGEMSKTNLLARWLHTNRHGWVYGGSIEMSSSQADTGGSSKTEDCPDYLPDLAALIQYQWNSGKSHVRLSGLLRGIAYRDLVAMKNRTEIGWGIQASAVAKIVNPLTMYGIISYGRGHASYSSDLSIGNYDLVPDPHNPGRLYAPPMIGFTWGATYYFRPNIYATVALGELKYLPDFKPDDTEYKYGLFGAVNCQWEVTPRLNVGLEYLAGKRVDFDSASGSANRVNLMMQFSF